MGLIRASIKKVINKGFITVLLLIGMYLLLEYIFPIFSPFIIGLIIAAIIEPVVRFFSSRLKMPRSLSVLVVLLVSLLLISVLLFIAVGQLVSELEQLVRLLPQYQNEITEWGSRQLVLIQKYYDKMPEPVIEAIESTRHSTYVRAIEMMKAILDGVRSIPNMFITLTVAFLAAYFMSRDRVVIRDTLTRMLPVNWRSKVNSFRSDVIQSVMLYIRAQLILMAITTFIVLCSLIILGVRYAWIIGIGAGLLDILPMVGPAAIFVPWALIAIAMGNGIFSLKLLLVLGITMAIRQLFEAKVVGQSIGVHPLLTLIALYVSIRLFGLLGFVFGPLVVIIGKALFNAGLWSAYYNS